MHALLPMICRFLPVIRRFGGDRRGNIAIIFALTMVPTIYLLGVALDYTQALRKQGQLNAAADAAAIAAIRPAMLVQSTDTAKATATAVFGATADSLPGLSSVPTPTITIVDDGLQRAVTVSYATKSINNFPSLLGSPAWPITGSSEARASSLPNMNFYLLLDDSPSMAIGATKDDIDNLKFYTASQPPGSRSCGFACHEVRPDLDKDASWTTKDNLSIARTKNVKLRIDLVVNAVNQLLVGPWQCPQAGVSGGVMQCMSALNNTSYQAALHTFDYKLNTLQSLASLSKVANKIPNIQLL